MAAVMRLPEPSNTVHAVVAAHPLVAAGRQVHSEPPLPNEPVRDYLIRIGVRIDLQPFYVGLNGRLLDVAEQAETHIQPGDMLTVRAALQGGGGDGESNPVATVLSIVVLAVAPYLTPLIGPLGTAVFLVASQYIINELTYSGIDDLSNQSDTLAKDSPTYSIAGGRNRARPGQPLPIVFGTHRVVPDLGAQPYTKIWNINSTLWGGVVTVLASDQSLYQVFNFGLTDITLSDFKIGNTPLENYRAYELQESGQDGVLTLFPTNVDELSVGVSMPGPVAETRLTSTDCTGITVELAGTLYKYNDNEGQVDDHRVEFDLEFRPVGSETWVPFFYSSPQLLVPYHRFSRLTLDGGSFRRTFRITLDAVIGDENGPSILPPQQYEVRVTRITPNDVNNENQVSDVTWTTMLSFQPDPGTYTNQKRVALKIAASGQLTGVVDQLSAVATAQQQIPQVGGGTVTGATSNPAWCLYNFASGRFDGTGRKLWGIGLPESRLDMDALFDFADFCDTNDLRCDLVIDRKMNAFDVLRIMAACGRGSPTWASGKLGVVWDADGLPVTGVYGMSNIIAGSFRVDYASDELADEIIGVFANQAEDYTLDEVSVLAPGVTSPVNSHRVEMMGVTRESQAARAANLIIAANEYHRRRISWDTDAAGMTNTRGDVVTISHDLTSWGYSGRLLAGSDTSLTLDRAVPFTPAEDHWLLLVEPNGDYSYHEITYQAGESDTLVPVADLSSVTNSAGNAVVPPDENGDSIALDYRFCFAPEATPGKKVKIVDIKPVDANRLRITARDEDPDYYTAESGTYQHTTPPDYIGRTPAITNVNFGEQLITRDGLTRVSIDWQLTGSDSTLIDVYLNGQRVGAPQHIIGSFYELTVPSGTHLDVSLRPFLLAPVGTIEPVEVSYDVLGKLFPPADITGFQAAVDGPYILLSWNRPTEIDIEGVDLRRGGTDFDDATQVDFVPQPGTQYRHTPTAAGITTFRAKAKDLSGIYSVNETTLDFNVAAANAPATVDVQVIDNNTVLNWSVAQGGTFGIAFYKVHVGTDINNPDQVYQVDGRFANIQHLESGQYTYHIFAVDIAGLEGAAKTVTATVTAPPDFVLKLDYNSDFSGTKTNMILDSAGVLQFPFAGSRQLVTQYSTNSWANWLDKVSAGYIYHFQPSETSASYEEIIDLGAVVGNNRIIATPTWSVLDGDVSLEITLSVRETTGDAWTVFTAGDADVFAANFRYIRVQLAATASGADDYAQLTRLNVRVNAKILTDTMKFIADEDDASGTEVFFNVPFADVSSINITPYSASIIDWAVDFSDVPNPTSFRVYTWDRATGLRTTVNCGAVVTGY